MPKVTVYNMAGASVGEMELADSVFGIQPNKAIMHAAVVNYLANQRQGTQSTLTRAEAAAAAANRGGRRNRPCPSGLYPFAPVAARRSGSWPKPRSYRFTLNKRCGALP